MGCEKSPMGYDGNALSIKMTLELDGENITSLSAF